MQNKGEIMFGTISQKTQGMPMQYFTNLNLENCNLWLNQIIVYHILEFSHTREASRSICLGRGKPAVSRVAVDALLFVLLPLLSLTTSD